MQMFLLNAHWRALWKRAQRLLAPRLLPDGPTLKRRHTSSSWTVSQAGRGSDGGVCVLVSGRLCWASRGAGRRCEAVQVVRKCEVSCRLGRLHPVAGAASCWRWWRGCFFFFFLVAPRRDNDLLLLFLPLFFDQSLVATSSPSARRSWLWAIGSIIVVWAHGLGLRSQKVMSEDTMSPNSKYSSQRDSTSIGSLYVDMHSESSEYGHTPDMVEPE